MANKFVGFLEAAGKDVEKGLAFFVKEAPVVEPLVSLIFPAATAALPAVNTAVTLIQNTVIATEQKYASVPTATGAQKAADVLTIAGPAATTLLNSAGVDTSDTSFISKIITAIVSILNIKPAAATA